MYNLKLDKSYKYLLACSYGPDSMALFHMLICNGINFDCAIVNYHLREESDSEVEGLLNYASKFNIKVYVYDNKKKLDKNIEANCRDIRYRFFRELTDKYHYKSVLVAHHQDDLIETYLMQKERQNCPVFYGIKEFTKINGVNIYRPLLNFSKQELLDICFKNKVPFSVDKTNFDISIKRNKIRHVIVAKLDKIERDKIIKEIDDENKALKDIFYKLEHTDLNDINAFLSLDEKCQIYGLNYLVEKALISTKLSKANVGEIINILKSSKPNGQFIIKKGVYLIKEYDYFELINEPLIDVNYLYRLEEPAILDTDYFYLDFTSDTSNRNVHKFDYPLTIRNIHLDDKIMIKSGYEVSANRLLIDWKTPYRLRKRWPVIINKDNKCIYIPRYQKTYKVKKTDNFYVK